MKRKRLLLSVLAFLLGGCLVLGTGLARAHSDTESTKAPEVKSDQLASWVRPVQYSSGAILVVAVGLLIFLRSRRSKPPEDKPDVVANPPG